MTGTDADTAAADRRRPAGGVGRVPAQARGRAAFMMVLFALGMALCDPGDARWLLPKGCVVTALAGLVFLGSAVLKRPLTFTVGKQLAAKDPESLAAGAGLA